MILALHLLIVQATTWVLVPSNTFSGSLWVGVAKAVLFRGLFHINAVRKLATEQCGGSSFLLDISQPPSIMFLLDTYPQQWSCLERCSWCQVTPSDLGFARLRKHSSSDHVTGTSCLDPFLYLLLLTFITRLSVLELLNVLGLGPQLNICIDLYS